MGLRNSQIGLKTTMQNNFNKHKIFYLFILFIPFIIMVSTIKYNRYKIKPSSQEISLLKDLLEISTSNQLMIYSG